MASSLLLTFILAQVALEPVPDDPAQVAEALSITRDWARRYAFSTADGAEFTLREEPILRWSNPSRGSVFGNVFVWTRDERPAVIGSLYKWFAPLTHMSHEFHALDDSPLVAARNEQTVWTTDTPGVTWQPVPDKPQVADAAGARLVQMRGIARAFTASKAERDETKFQELRLLTQPVYRYASPSQKVVDGALFAFVQGTDPELILWLEAVGADDKPEWRYALARMNSVSFRVSYQDKVVWDVGPMAWDDVRGHRLPYTTWSAKDWPTE
jgi:hypothetical protein